MQNSDIQLRVTLSRERWIAYGEGSESSDGGTTQAAVVGPFPQPHFPALAIISADTGEIAVADGSDAPRLLHPGGSVCFRCEVPGRETSDGCVCDGTIHYCVISWP